MSKPFRALIIDGGLHEKPTSSLDDLIAMTAKRLRAARVRTSVVRLADKRIPLGLKHRQGKGDQWPAVARAIAAADILIMASPVWWGPGPSSLIQRALERMDAFDEEYLRTGTSRLYNKTAGVLTTGAEDGVQQVAQHIMNPLQFLGFAFPPECVSYWVGEVGISAPSSRVRMARNPSVDIMNRRLVRNLLIMAKLLRKKPFPTTDPNRG